MILPIQYITALRVSLDKNFQDAAVRCGAKTGEKGEHITMPYPKVSTILTHDHHQEMWSTFAFLGCFIESIACLFRVPSLVQT